jgi:hypothetical protein
MTSGRGFLIRENNVDKIKQPRKDNPVSWEKDYDYPCQNVFPDTATSQEIASHLNLAIMFVREGRTCLVCPCEKVPVKQASLFPFASAMC